MASRAHQVEVLVGKDKGKQGKVIDVDRSLNRVFVKGLNTVQYTNKYQRPININRVISK